MWFRVLKDQLLNNLLGFLHLQLANSPFALPSEIGLSGQAVVNSTPDFFPTT